MVEERMRAAVGERGVNLRFDVDCPDAVHAPGSGTPVALGAWGNVADQALRRLRVATAVNRRWLRRTWWR